MINVDPKGVYIFSTDTVYGLGTALSNAAGIDRIYALKGRDAKKPMAVLVASLEQADTLIDWPTPLYREPLKKLWPGALTIVVPAKPEVSLKVRAGFATLGLRCPDHPVLQAMLHTHGPWVATSVNLAGQPPLMDEDLIRSSFQNQVDGFLFFEPRPNGQASTVIDLTVVPPKVLRPGPADIRLLMDAGRMG